jgi:hypothetical protein
MHDVKATVALHDALAPLTRGLTGIEQLGQRLDL